MAAFETNTYTCGGTALAAFQMITFPCGGTALAAFEVNPLPFEAGRRWRHLRLTHTLVAGRLGGISDDHIPLWRDGDGGICDKHIFLWRDGIGGI